eukprot:TRINITY_DN9261_c0_g1_i1.p1 TRINITY_DN9261_c0_g1~~TRINITY_DN9261_c0_g1_i1.p1  ORF type:complete len:364 (-),score=50.76 TRINITY_DN9261_c0_g1_i1:165-1208(-)
MDDGDIIGVSVFSFLLFISIIAFYFIMFIFKNTKRRLLSSSAVFFYFLLVFLSLRIIWFFFKSGNNRDLSFLLNRISFTFFLCSMCTVFYTWTQVFLKFEREKGEKKLLALRVILLFFISANFMIQIFAITYLLLQGDVPKEGGSSIYDLTVYAIVSSVLLLAVGFFVIGLSLFFLTSYTLFSGKYKKIQLLKISTLSFIFILCLISKGIAFLYRPLTSKFLNDLIFIFIGYIIPEAFPAFVQIVVMTRRAREIQQEKKSRATQSKQSASKFRSKNDDHSFPLTEVIANGTCPDVPTLNLAQCEAQNADLSDGCESSTFLSPNTLSRHHHHHLQSSPDMMTTSREEI